MILYSGMQIQNIQDVVNQLAQIIEQSEATKNKAGFFAALYKRMTIAVMNSINTNQFEDGARMEKLDMILRKDISMPIHVFFRNNLVLIHGNLLLIVVRIIH